MYTTRLTAFEPKIQIKILYDLLVHETIDYNDSQLHSISVKLIDL